jgi:hypothetical protein
VRNFIYRNNNSKKITFFFLSPTPFFFRSVPPFPYLFHPSYLSSVFIRYFSQFLSSIPLSHFATSIPHVLNCTFFLLLPSNTCFLSSRSHIQISPSFFFLLHSLSPRYSGISSVIQLSYSLLYLDSLIFSLLSCLSVSLSLLFSSTFIHLPFALNFSTSLLAYPFLW